MGCVTPATSPMSQPCCKDLPGPLGQQDLLSFRDTLSHVLPPTSAETERGPLHSQKGWMETISFPGKDTFCPGDPPEAHQSMRCLTFVEALVAYTSWCPPDNVLGLPVTHSSPNPAHHPKAGHSWDSLPWRGERRSRKRTFILGSSLLWLGLQGDSRAWKGTKERGHVSI